MGLNFTPDFLDRLVKRDPRAWEAFFQEYDPLFRTIPTWAKWGFNADAREEVVQAARSAVYEAMPALSGSTAVRAYIKTITMRKCVDHIRSQVRHRLYFSSLDAQIEEAGIEAEDVERSFDPIREVEREERAKELWRHMGELDPICVEVLKLFYLEGLKYTQIASKLQREVGTIGARLSKCLVKLQLRLNNSSVFREYFPASSDKVKMDKELP